jgi:hypothetical protein
MAERMILQGTKTGLQIPSGESELPRLFVHVFNVPAVPAPAGLGSSQSIPKLNVKSLSVDEAGDAHDADPNSSEMGEVAENVDRILVAGNADVVLQKLVVRDLGTTGCDHRCGHP